MLFFNFLVTALVSLNTFAALKSDGKTHLIQNTNDRKISISVDDGFHFNLEAPTFLLNGQTKEKPSSRSEKKLEFQTPKMLAPGAKIQFYVCDDAKTVCEPHTENISPNNKENTPNTEVKTPNRKVKKDLDGFILDNFEAAITSSSKTHKLILVDFTASWCPACLRLTHESFKSQAFKNLKSKFVLLKIDVDKSENQNLLEKYSIKAFPSMVVLTSKGEEIDRILDYLPGEPLVAKLKAIISSSPLIDAKMRAAQGDKGAALIVAMNAYKAQQPKDCVEWFEKSGQKPVEYYQCLLTTLEDSAHDKQIPTIESAISAFPNSFYSIDWRLKLIELTDIDHKKLNLIKQTEDLCRDWLKDPGTKLALDTNNQIAELKDLITPELHFYLGALLELQKLPTEAKLEFEKSVAATLSLKPTIDNPTIIIYLVHYLKKSEKIDTARDWLHRLQNKYPNEFTYFHREASLLNDSKNFSQALPAGQKAFELSYGNNRIKTGLLLAKIQKNLDKKLEAKATLEGLLDLVSKSGQPNKVFVSKIEAALSELK